MTDGNRSYYGVNESPLIIDGIFDSEVEINGIAIPMKFFVVPNQTMSYTVLLGRDYIMSLTIKISPGCKFDIENVASNDKIENSDYFEHQIMQIDCVDENSNIDLRLDIDSTIVLNVSARVQQLYYEELISSRNDKTVPNNMEMVISVKTEQPISFRPRRLSFADKEKLQNILDELLDRNIIRPSNSPCASPVVLVRKKLETYGYAKIIGN
ncbi:uncharacterized protein LOC144477812 [Augochlora pura]